MMVETSVDLRSSAAWSQFDATINQFGGESPQQATPAFQPDDGASTLPAETAVTAIGIVREPLLLLSLSSSLSLCIVIVASSASMDSLVLVSSC